MAYGNPTQKQPTEVTEEQAELAERILRSMEDHPEDLYSKEWTVACPGKSLCTYGPADVIGSVLVVNRAINWHALEELTSKTPIYWVVVDRCRKKQENLDEKGWGPLDLCTREWLLKINPVIITAVPHIIQFEEAFPGIRVVSRKFGMDIPLNRCMFFACRWAYCHGGLDIRLLGADMQGPSDWDPQDGSEIDLGIEGAAYAEKRWPIEEEALEVMTHHYRACGVKLDRWRREEPDPAT